MSDNFVVLKADNDSEPYRVEIPGVGKFVIPHVNTVSVFELNDAIDAAQSQLDVLMNVFRLVMADEDYEQLKKAGINRPTFVALYNAWEAHCGMGTGESPASSD